ncbi:MAG TPA: hypothetical protein VGO71_19425, partial [Baekduia sp.]|nr:hypothetical protein [Baekduia sp.]
PSLAEVLIQRTFAKPTQPFVDGEFIQALSHADDDRPSVAATARAAAEVARGTGPGRDSGAGDSGPHAAPAPVSPSAKHGPSIDVRA